ncbi:MAG TPA: 2-succinyl-5-enolpyruvyl-6-hydroxy-3-cyclohexene-1-carboxylic-acid synthase [Solirubrobacteraceae bacterium]|nr:2-succinyl-5-enolpyruvyl-6-hydroxy-3-cyclohexene-1-carboxylic-acid synthase [Solirubrobacteraceae bacterium]
MTAIDTYRLLRAFVDELSRCGMRAACTSPGSRCAPLVLSLTRDERLACYSHIDERCAGFFALGLARAGGQPVALACTSGTAAAELAPAVHEAHEARVPLLVLTADRPPELRDTGAGQTIDQLKLYGDAVKWFVEVGTHDANTDRIRWIRSLACRAWWTAQSGRPGPVQLNFALREPLVLDEPLTAEPAESAGRAGGRPWLTRPQTRALSAPDVLDGFAADLRARRRGVIVAGRTDPPELGASIAQLAQRAGYPLLADPQSGARRGPLAVAHYDALLRDHRFAAAHAPELVLRIGDLPTSKPLRRWLARLPDALQVRIDAEDSWQDPDAATATLLASDPAATIEALVAESPGAAAHDQQWVDSWIRADAAAATAIASALADDLCEPRVAAELGARLPAEVTCMVASSMPVRDLETFWPVRDAPPRTLSNRGANGIDGTVSTAFGAAAVADGPVVLVIGDVALAHDIGGLLAASRLGLKLTIVLLNNDGGGIFHFLPIANEPDAFEQHIATPHGLDFAHAAALYGCRYERAADAAGFSAALDRALAAPTTMIVEVGTDRSDNVAVHERVWEAVASAATAAT